MAPALIIVDAISAGDVLPLILPCEGDENFTSVISGARRHEMMDFLTLIASWVNECLVSYAPSSIALNELSTRRFILKSVLTNLLMCLEP
jgi:hypothetical protein